MSAATTHGPTVQGKTTRESPGAPAGWNPLDDYVPEESDQLLKDRSSADFPACQCGCGTEGS